ncbi:hypothetical protein E8F11_04615 [Pseudomonas sp. BN417]|nr:hypothetical protein [Pseudomonas sp. BN417]
MKGMIALLLGAVIALTGCSFSAPGVHARIGDADAVRVDLGGGHYHDGGGFCPPGHRMKGEC